MSLFPSDTDDEMKALKGASLDEVITARDCVIFSTPACGWCIKAKRFLTEDLMVRCSFYSLHDSPLLARDLINKTGMRTVPNIYIKGRHVGGYDELQKIYRKCRSGDPVDTDQPICDFMARACTASCWVHKCYASAPLECRGGASVMSSTMATANPNEAEAAAPEFIYHQDRVDGRKCAMLRPPTLELGLLPHKDGSARLGFGDTEVLVGINGPVENRFPLGVSTPGYPLDVSVRRASGMPTAEDKSVEYQLTKFINTIIDTHLLPGNTMITIAVEVLNDDGSLLSTILNAAILAMLDAGSIPLRGTAFAAALSKRYQRGVTQLLVDPDRSEEESSVFNDTIVIDIHSQDVVMLVEDVAVGTAKEDGGDDALAPTGVAAVKAFEKYVRSCLAVHYQKIRTLNA
ncbi:Exosome component 5 [Perkinsus olseni]|uniref:Exosome component 5 n=1 Tax=Perkinsus olseni TaxID=32597 RepID=A0A7J6QGT2_PEROL|nr:Exosome component 5 [Perkinsus olseni]